MSAYLRLTLYEREFILRLRAKGYSTRFIAKFLRRAPSTISRELKRNTIQISGYNPYLAQDLAEARQRICVGHNRQRPEYKRWVGVRDYLPKLPRIFVAWHSDIKFYPRGFTGFMGSNVYRLPSLLATKDKPFHFLDLLECHRLLRRWWRWQEFRERREAIYSGRKPADPIPKKKPLRLSYSKRPKTEAIPKTQPATLRQAG
ncbi:hypothetical protein FUAX_32810 [Fulvitalea axinellae]|uniref:Transposase IS30-like HTH domain-containing protein n=1 Tax=Fulvitalea axinellae TaxID=1182444 RepID=A0AAU9D8G0_9BACT|nr:hypothetical protein FUAX_32810 [Fulvitalea axinellae]